MPFCETDLKIESLRRNGAPSRPSHGCHSSGWIWRSAHNAGRRLTRLHNVRVLMTRFSVGIGSSVKFDVGTRCLRFLRRHVVGVCTAGYERGVPALSTTVPPILASCTHTGSPADNVLNACARSYRS